MSAHIQLLEEIRALVEKPCDKRSWADECRAFELVLIFGDVPEDEARELDGLLRRVITQAGFSLLNRRDIDRLTQRRLELKAAQRARKTAQGALPLVAGAECP